MGITLPTAAIADFCRKWRVTEFSLFGSVLRDDFGPDSDIDVLLTFERDAPWSLWDLIHMKDELEDVFGREVDIVEKKALRNPIRKRAILDSHRVVYAT